jgi:aspartate racemase
MKTIGMLGGMSWESTALYYRTANELVRERRGGLASADLLVRSLDFAEVRRLQLEDRWDDAADLLLREAKALEAGGADLVVLCTNYMHKVAPALETGLGVPFLHIADVVGRAARERGAVRVGPHRRRRDDERALLRRAAGPLRPRGARPGRADREVLDRAVFDELCQGVLSPTTRTALRGRPRAARRRGGAGRRARLHRARAAARARRLRRAAAAERPLHVEAAVAAAGGLADAEQVDDEDQRLVGPDGAPGAARAVAELRRDRQPAAAADLHAGDALVPAGDDHALAEAEGERLAAVPRRRRTAARRPGHPDVLHGARRAGDGLGTVPDGEVLHDQLGGRRAVGDLDGGLVAGLVIGPP